MEAAEISRPLGVFVLGARGSVATTMAVGTHAIARGLSDATGLVTALPELAALPLIELGDLVIGGYEVRRAELLAEARTLAAEGVMPPALVEAIAPELEETDRRVRPGHLYESGPAIESLATPGYYRAVSPACIVTELVEDLESFRRSTGCAQVVVVNLASTEPAPVAAPSCLESQEELTRALAGDEAVPGLPLSTIYAFGAFSAGCPYINFTPSLGAACPALLAMAEEAGLPHAGRDGKTGETLLKTVLAPMLVARNLRLRSWHGTNLLGNRDGLILDRPENLTAKLESKDVQLRALTGREDLDTSVRIDYVPSLGEWKTAWDFVHFDGFLGTRMGLEFTWRGCDSTLAAPLVLDLIRLVDHARRVGLRGGLTHLACFFKNPVGTREHDFQVQMQLLRDYAGRHCTDSVG